MPEENNDITQYSAADFERYHTGSMPEKEMHALEKAALEDPFLADALEGYMFAKTPVDDINELKEKLAAKKEERKVIWFNRKPLSILVRVAAILILFGGLGWMLFNRNETMPAKEIASLNKRQQETDNALQTDSLKPPDVSITNSQWGTLDIPDSLQQTRQDYSQLKVPPAFHLETTQSEPVSSMDYLAPSAYTIDTVKIDAVASKAAKEESGNVNNALAGKVPGVQIRSMEPSPAPIKLRGRITDTKGEPVAFATIYDTKRKNGIQADQDGEFYFMAKDSITKVNVNAVGYTSLLAELRKNKDSNVFVLQQTNNALQEVIVTSAFQKKRSKSVSSSVTIKTETVNRISVSNAIPVNGWEAFNNYVTDSLKTIQQLGTDASSAEVMVSFNVNKQGEPIDINIQKSLCIACDAEALRIIKNGPSWKLNKKRKKAKAVVRF